MMRSGVLTPPPSRASFEGSVGIWGSHDQADSRPVFHRGMRDRAGWRGALRWAYACNPLIDWGLMKPLIATALGAAVVLLTACSHTPPKLIQPPSYAGQQVASADAAGDPAIVCTREIPTGLRQTVTRCRNTAEVERRRELDRSWAEKIPAELPEPPR